MAKKTIPIAKIKVDAATHPRDQLDVQTAEEYGQAMKAGEKFPPIVVFQKGKQYFLADGMHRLEGAKQFGLKEIAVDVRQGSRRDATLFAVAANHKHGLRRTNKDKRKAVEIVLADREWRKWSVNRIADLCHVSWDLVNEIRKTYLPETEDGEERLVERGGTTYGQKVGKRGRKKKKVKKVTPVTMVVDLLGPVADVRRRFRREDKPELAEAVDDVVDRLQRIVGKATGARRMVKDLRVPLNVYEHHKKEGISATPDFVKKRLCNYAVNVGMICGHQCTYCSTAVTLRRQPFFRGIQQTSFKKGYAVIDPQTPERIRKGVPKLTSEDVVQLCTLDDAWSPEAREHNLGRKCLQFLLEETPAQVRILTKSATVAEDFDLLKPHAERVIVGLSTGIPASREDVAEVIEPNASSVRERLAALKKASELGVRTFGMLCPCLPGVSDSREALEEMFGAVLECNVEGIWLEPVNARGSGLRLTSDALWEAGLDAEAQAVDTIRIEGNWSLYATSLIKLAISVAKSHGVLNKLHILLYPGNLSPEHVAELKKCRRGIIWLKDPDESAADD